MTPPRFTFKLGLILLLLGGMVSYGVSSNMLRTSLLTASAEETGPPAEVEAAGNRAGACLDQFSNFISTLLSKEDAKDYFQDLFVRNRCQQDDIFGLDSQVESKMKTLRGLYFDSCSSPEIGELKEDIISLKMEEYFIRHIVPVEEDATFKRDAEVVEKDFDAIKFALTLDMKDRFIDEKEWVADEPALEALMQGWLDKYDDRLDEYVSCSTSPWQEVADKWKEFQEGIKQLGEIMGSKPQAVQDHEAEQQAEAEARAKEAGTSDTGEKNGGGTSVPGFLKKMFSIRMNGVEPQRNTGQLAAEAKKNRESLSINSSQEATNAELDRYKREIEKAALLAQYDLLYSQGSADITNDLVTRLTGMRTTIEGTTKGALHALIESAKSIHTKQGKTSPN